MLENTTKTTKRINIMFNSKIQHCQIWEEDPTAKYFPQCYWSSSQNLLARTTLCNRISWAKHPLSKPESTLFLLKTATWKPHKTQCFRTISTTVMLLLHTWKKPTHDTVTTGVRNTSSREQIYREELHCPGAQKEAGENLILKTFLLRHLSTYFSALSHLK